MYHIICIAKGVPDTSALRTRRNAVRHILRSDNSFIIHLVERGLRNELLQNGRKVVHTDDHRDDSYYLCKGNAQNRISISLISLVQEGLMATFTVIIDPKLTQNCTFDHCRDICKQVTVTE